MAESTEQQRKRMEEKEKRNEEEKNTKQNYNIYQFIINDGKEEDIERMDTMLKKNIITDVDVRKPDIKNNYDSIKDWDSADNDYKEFTALMYQTLYGTYEAMDFLLYNGADPDIKSKDGCSLLQLLVSQGDYPDRVQLLLDNGADKNATCIKKLVLKKDEPVKDMEMTPLDWLKRSRPTGRENTINILETHVDPPKWNGLDNPYGKGGARRNKSKKSKKSRKSRKSKKSRKSRRSRK